MGQCYYLINIDKSQKVFLGSVGGIFALDMTAYLCDQAHSSWAGDRLILLGDYVQDVPAGIDDKTNYQDLFAMFVDDTSHRPGHPPCREDSHYGKNSVLRNLCTREYIRVDLFLDLNSCHYGFEEIIMPKILWCSNHKWHVDTRGPWAGGRFDIVHVDVVKGHSEWNDITETAFFNYYKFLAESGMMDPLDSKCTCMRGVPKYCNEHESFYNSINNQKKPQQKERAYETVGEQATQPPWSAAGAFYPSGTNSLSTIKILPAELRENIIAHLSTGDWAACATASKVLSFQATPHLYSPVTIERADQTKTLLETISRCPELARLIKDLRFVTMAHWESLQIAHEILKQLSSLKSLTIAPCWLSYGTLPYWEYPFTIETLTWGLKQDSAFDQFRLSQPGV